MLNGYTPQRQLPTSLGVYCKDEGAAGRRSIRLKGYDYSQSGAYFVTIVTRHGVADHCWPPFDGHLWQRNYYECILRDSAHVERVRRYILANPRN
jgi:REP element-mobilizing transposase RayT